MKKKKNAGFSLIELMVVVGIIGILASMAIPRFQEFQAKARQSEAKTNLNYIATLQEAYFDDPVSMNAYFTGLTVDQVSCAAEVAMMVVNPLGFSPTPCTKLGYSYVITGTATTHLTTANEYMGQVFMCATSMDQWTINQLRNLGHPAAGMSC